jgi:hypothetical protein
MAVFGALVCIFVCSHLVRSLITCPVALESGGRSVGQLSKFSHLSIINTGVKLDPSH